MKTALYVGANGNVDFVNSDYDRIICTDSRMFTNVTEHILDEFRATMRSNGFRLKLTYISYNRPFYVKCFNENKYIKYCFNTGFPTGSLLKYEVIDAIIFGRDYAVHPPEYKDSLIRSIAKYLGDNYVVMQT